ncbi:MAG: hypothetical protein LBU32_19585 [Clostridiales bacterium]|jgi:hypothetical protein|nr:hypothetical protein [Clostridiales bacterium]
MVIDRTSTLEYADEVLAKERDAANAALKECETGFNINRLAWDKEEPEANVKQRGVAVERVVSVLGGSNRWRRYAYEASNLFFNPWR